MERCLSLKTGTLRPLCFEDLHHSLEEFITRVKSLPLFVLGIAAMLGDQDDAIDGQARSTQAKRFFDRRKLLQFVPGDSLAGEVVFRNLIDIHRGDVEAWCDPCSAPGIAERHPIEEMLGVRMGSHHGADEGNLFSGLCCPRQRRGHRERCGTCQELASCGHGGFTGGGVMNRGGGSFVQRISE